MRKQTGTAAGLGLPTEGTCRLIAVLTAAQAVPHFLRSQSNRPFGIAFWIRVTRLLWYSNEIILALLCFIDERIDDSFLVPSGLSSNAQVGLPEPRDRFPTLRLTGLEVSDSILPEQSQIHEENFEQTAGTMQWERLVSNSSKKISFFSQLL